MGGRPDNRCRADSWRDRAAWVCARERSRWNTMLHRFRTRAVAEMDRLRMAAHENLSGGLIGIAGVIFAAWLAYSGAQDQLAHVRMAAEEANRLRAQERFQEANTEVETLKLAGDYLRTFAGNFPDEDHPQYHSHSFIGTLSDLSRTARLYVSESAANAPRGFGRSIATVMWRLEKLAEKIVELGDRGGLVDGTRTSMEKEVRLAVAASRKIADEIKQLIPSLRERRAILREQYV